jgi:hypothetical protein
MVNLCEKVKAASEATTEGNTNEAMTNLNPNKETRNSTYGINFNKVNYGTKFAIDLCEPSGAQLQSTYGTEFNQCERSGALLHST